jgi:hypothetical protein
VTLVGLDYVLCIMSLLSSVDVTNYRVDVMDSAPSCWVSQAPPSL